MKKETLLVSSRPPAPVLLLLLTTFLVLPAIPQIGLGASLECVVCGQSPLAGKVWKHKLGHVCQACYESPNRCSVCGLPAPKNFLQTSDGRIFCERDKKDLIVDSDEVQATFTRARGMLWEMLGSGFRLKSPKVTVNVFDVDYWNHRNGKRTESASRRKGLAQTRQVGDQFVHTVLLLSGQGRSELLSVCAHEYTHLWINENRNDQRDYDRDTIEAICELVSFKLMGYRKEAAEQDRIRENPYTRGRIHDLIAIEQERGMAWILNWIKNGSEPALLDNRVAKTNTEVANSGGLRPKTTIQARPAAAAEPTSLKLQGLSGTGNRRFALINGEIVAANDEASINVDGETIRFQCLELRDEAALIQILGESAPKLLSLRD